MRFENINKRSLTETFDDVRVCEGCNEETTHRHNMTSDKRTWLAKCVTCGYVTTFNKEEISWRKPV